jgi:hypothetical protein
MGVSGAASLPHATRNYRQTFGRYRVCYEASLSKNPELAGHWLARVTHVEKVCSIQVIDTDLPPAMSECLTEAIKTHVNVPESIGQLELVLAFRP